LADSSEQAGTAAVRMFSGMEVVVVVYCIAIHLYLFGVVDGAGLANTGSRSDTPSVPGAGSLWYTYSGTHTTVPYTHHIHRAQYRGHFLPDAGSAVKVCSHAHLHAVRAYKPALWEKM
jgi:hypothetical protein